MMVSLSAPTQAPSAQSQAVAAVQQQAAQSQAASRATQPDTVSISAKGQQLAQQASQDVDHDGDSH